MQTFLLKLSNISFQINEIFPHFNLVIMELLKPNENIYFSDFDQRTLQELTKKIMKMLNIFSLPYK